MCVTIATLPVILIISGQIPVISLFLNVIVIPLMSLIMISGIFTGIAGMLSLEAAYFLREQVDIFLIFIISCAVCHHILNMQSLLREPLILQGCFYILRF